MPGAPCTNHINRVSLLSYRTKQKFAPEEWDKRGLSSSDDSICKLMEETINHCIDQLLTLIKNEAKAPALRSLVKKEIQNAPKKNP